MSPSSFDYSKKSELLREQLISSFVFWCSSFLLEHSVVVASSSADADNEQRRFSRFVPAAGETGISRQISDSDSSKDVFFWVLAKLFSTGSTDSESFAL